MCKTIAVAMLLAVSVIADNCTVSPGDRKDCGHVGTEKPDCEASGCCWSPVQSHFLGGQSNDTPWCFHPSSGPSPPSGDCSSFDWSATDPGFTDDFYDKMYTIYMGNLNIQGTGAVVAAPDQHTPGGSYYYHWMRDGALSMDVFMDLNDMDHDKIKMNMDAYTKWVKGTQSQKDDNNDVRIEPKFEIPSGAPYTGGWCRPQTDGPGLRARTLSHWGSVLVKKGNADAAKNDVWPLVSNDMAWVTANWQSNGCDLWEEARNTDFFWGRMGFVNALKAAADFAKSIGEEDTAANYLNVASDISNTLDKHWNGTYITESDNSDTYHTHGVDGATIHAIASFPNSVYGPLSSQTAATIKNHNTVFCNEYAVNRTDNGAKIPGILIGRYPGDHYANGNPWQLLSAALAELFYNGASEMQKQVKASGNFKLSDANADHKAWKEVLNLGENATASDFVTASKGAGDSVLTRVYSHVKNDGGRIDEQIDKVSGQQISAKTLTWSHANILHALKVRKSLTSEQTEYLQ